MNKIIIFVSVLFLLNSCYEKEDISAELGKPLHEFKDGPNMVDHKIFEYYGQTGGVI